MTGSATDAQAPVREMRHCALFDRVITHDNPHETIIPEIHAGPAVFFADNVTLNQPGWVVRRAEDLRKIYADTENYHKRGNTGFARMIGEDWDIIPTDEAVWDTLVRRAPSYDAFIHAKAAEFAAGDEFIVGSAAERLGRVVASKQPEHGGAGRLASKRRQVRQRALARRAAGDRCLIVG